MADPIATFDPARALLQWGGGSVQFAPKQALIFGCVARHKPIASYEVIVSTVWGGDPPDCVDVSLKVQAHHIRESLRHAKAPVALGKVWGQGLILTGGDVDVIGSGRTLLLSAETERVLRDLIHLCPDLKVAGRAHALLGIA
jgi:hypothetical protein